MVEQSLHNIVSSRKEFDRLVDTALSYLLEYSTRQTKRFLRDVGKWENNIVHEKLAQRWAYEVVERFITIGRTELPCRPFPLFESIIFQHWSRPRPCEVLPEESGSPLSRFINGLLSRAVHSRDAMNATFYHLYGLTQQEVTTLLGLGSVESQRVYKNFTRWRSHGWQRMVEETGLKAREFQQIRQQQLLDPRRFRADVMRTLSILQPHYRKSEPSFYPCLSAAQWEELYAQDYGRDYRGWHLPFCHGCLGEVWKMRHGNPASEGFPVLDIRTHPLSKLTLAGC